MGFSNIITVSQLAEVTAGGIDACSVWLRNCVAEPPADGTNRLIVTHAPNILDAFVKFIESVCPGQMLIFRPRGAGSEPELLACVRCEQWSEIAGSG